MKKLYKINQFTAAEWDSIEYDWNEHEDEIVIIEKKDAYCMDITANGKRIVPILRKIEEAMTAAGLAGETGIYAGWFGEWANELTDRRDRKYFIWNYSGQSDRERGCWSYSWGIEQIDDDRWYIFLNIAKPQEETEETETETTAPAEDPEAVTLAPAEDAQVWDENGETVTPDTDTEEEEEAQTMKNTNTKKYSFEIRQLDAWGNAEEGYDINESWHMGEMQTKAQNIQKAFTAWMKRHLGITFKNNRTLIEYDGDCYTIIDRKTKEPLFIAIPQY